MPMMACAPGAGNLAPLPAIEARDRAAGRRGSAWIKVDTARTLDLVVLAVEWGSGQRHSMAEQHAPRCTGDPATVNVRPELVVEIAFDEVQRSTQYRGGVALRFVRV